MSCLCEREKWLISHYATCPLKSLSCLLPHSRSFLAVLSCSYLFALPFTLFCSYCTFSPLSPCLCWYGVLWDNMWNEETVFKVCMQVQNAVVDVEVIGQQEAKCVAKMIFLSAVLFLFLLLLPFPSRRQTIQDSALFGGWVLPFWAVAKVLSQLNTVMLLELLWVYSVPNWSSMRWHSILPLPISENFADKNVQVLW